MKNIKLPKRPERTSKAARRRWARWRGDEILARGCCARGCARGSPHPVRASAPDLAGRPMTVARVAEAQLINTNQGRFEARCPGCSTGCHSHTGFGRHSVSMACSTAISAWGPALTSPNALAPAHQRCPRCFCTMHQVPDCSGWVVGLDRHQQPQT